jgi:signal transduction histidine kinase
MVWTNLLDTALAAVGEEGTVTVRTRGEPDTVVVEIENTGPTVPPEVLGRAFEAFFTTKPVGQGTGLGLDVSWRIVVQRHGGDLRVASTPGDTRFSVVLPLTEPTARPG